MTDFSVPDLKQARPDSTNYESGWARTRITAVTPTDDRLQSLASAISKTHVNGGAYVAQFEIEPDPAIAWYLSRDQVEGNFFRDFFTHEAVCKKLKAGHGMRLGGLGFEARKPHEALTELEHIMERGGAYRSYTGDKQRLRKLVNGFAHAVNERRFTGLTVWTSSTPWSDWFFDVAWGGSHFWIDKTRGLLTILLITDTD